MPHPCRPKSRIFGVVGTRISWGILDQGLSSITNAALSFFVARSVSQNGFGSFAVAFTVYTIVIGISRSLVSQPLTLRFSDSSLSVFRKVAPQVSAAAALLGIVTATVCVGFGLIVGGDLRACLFALALTLPGLLVQDAWRLIFFACGRPALAALNDLIWTLAQVLSVGTVLAAGWVTPAAFLLAWGSAAALAALFGVWQLRSRLTLVGGWLWFRAHRDLTGYLVAEFIGITGAFQGAVLVLGAVGGVKAVAAIRAAQVLLGPLNILVGGVFATVLPEIVRRQLDWRGRCQAAFAISSTMPLAPIIWTGLLLAMPYKWGLALLGETWAGGRSVLLASGLGYTAICVTLGPGLLLLALQRTRTIFWLSMSLAPPLFIFGLIGIKVGGVSGAAIGFAAAQWLVVPLWWLRFRALACTGFEPE
jgi:O-antigen/teichoic acid export membrane protein